MFNSISFLTRSLSFGKIIGGISKTLNIANQIIPLYLKAKPMITNANKTFGVLKELVKPTDSSKTNTSRLINSNQISPNNAIKKEENNPTFFL